MTIAVDFDGTIVEDRYPSIGQEQPFATDTLKMLIKEGHRILLWTVREGKFLEDAVNWLQNFKNLAKKHSLLETGGLDTHQENPFLKG